MSHETRNSAPERPTELRAQFTTTQDGTVELTLSPSSPSAAEQTTAWISASEGSFVELSDAR